MRLTLALAFLVLSSNVMAQEKPELIAGESRWGDPLEGKVVVVEDDKRGVTCYVYNAHKEGGIFCFTKKQLEEI